MDSSISSVPSVLITVRFRQPSERLGPPPKINAKEVWGLTAREGNPRVVPRGNKPNVVPPQVKKGGRKTAKAACQKEVLIPKSKARARTKAKEEESRTTKAKGRATKEKGKALTETATKLPQPRRFPSHQSTLSLPSLMERARRSYLLPIRRAGIT